MEPVLMEFTLQSARQISNKWSNAPMQNWDCDILRRGGQCRVHTQWMGTCPIRGSQERLLWGKSFELRKEKMCCGWWCRQRAQQGLLGGGGVGILAPVETCDTLRVRFAESGETGKELVFILRGRRSKSVFYKETLATVYGKWIKACQRGCW